MSSIQRLKVIASNYSVLYVEDDPVIADSFKNYLSKFFAEVDYFSNGKDALESYKKDKHNIVITDIQMPIMNGLEMASKIKDINPEQNILITSAYSDNDKFTNSIKIGVDGYIIKPIDYDDLNSILLKVLTKIRKFEEHHLYEEKLKNTLEQKTTENLKLNYEKIDNFEKTLYALIEIIESRDTYTGKHSLRVANYSKMIAEELGIDKEECEELYRAGILHDIGKIAIPDSLLLKPGKLYENEYNLIKEHVNIGFHMLSQIPMFKEIAQIINCHHERLDGSGYPNGIKGDEIPFKANIMALADSFDAMTTNRIYKGRKTVDEALQEIKSLSNIHYKEEIVNAASKVLSTVKIDYNINQLPKTTLEEERFAYFYKDNLTQIYNEKYLDFVLSKNQFDKKFSKINLIFIHNFSKYNKENGWTKGNNLLVEFAQKLVEVYKKTTIFRIHGDDFVILSASYDFKESSIEELEDFIQNFSKDLTITSKILDIEENEILSTLKLEKLLFD